MTQSLNIILPSIHRNKSKSIPTKQQQKPLQFKISKSHGRTTSAPTSLPSHQQDKLSLSVLLDAIDLDQQMRRFFKTEVLKSKNRTNHFTVPTLMARRRSKSAPGAPPSYHYQRAFHSKWYYNSQTVTSASAAQEVALQIVQKHIESVKKRE